LNRYYDRRRINQFEEQYLQVNNLFVYQNPIITQVRM